MDHFPVQNWAKHHPKFIYSRISKQRYRSPRPRYGVTRTRYSVKPSRKIMRRYRNSVNTKYGEPGHYKRPPKFRYPHQKGPRYQSKYEVSKRSPYRYNTREPTGFAEPPIDLLDYHFPKTAYGEPSVHAGLAESKDPVKHPHILSDPIDVDQVDYEEVEHAQKGWPASDDSKYAPSYVPFPPAFSKPRPAYESHFQPDGKSLFDFFNYDKPLKTDNRKRKKKTTKAKAATPAPRSTELPEPQVVVGGRYAEPPARYFSQYDHGKFDGDFAPAEEAMDPDIAASATVSPYVNYKHGNVAFSPQNLNDAFSIVE